MSKLKGGPMLKSDQRVDNVKPIDKIYPWWFGGSSSCMAVCLTHPLDLVKVRMQAYEGTSRPGVIAILRLSYGAEGVRGWYHGLTAGLARQVMYGATRFACYEKLKRYAQTDPSSPLYTLTCISTATISGLVGGIVGTPADLANVRMQNDAALPAARRRNYRNVFVAWSRIYAEDGIKGLYKGFGPNATRSAIVTGCQLGCYDAFVAMIRNIAGTQDSNDGKGTLTHLAASILAGATATTVCSPIDVVKTQIMQAKAAPGGRAKGVLETVRGNIASDGVRWMVRGWVPSFARVGPHTVATMIFYEQHKRLYNTLTDSE